MKDALSRAISSEKRNKEFAESIGPALVTMLEPILIAIAETIEQIPNEVESAISKVKIDAPVVNVPKIDAPRVTVQPTEVNVPTPVVNYTPPTINVPEPKVTVNVPKQSVKVEMPVKGIINELKAVKRAVSEQREAFDRDVVIPEYTHKKPIPAILVNALGKPWEPLAGAGAAVNRMLRFTDSGGTERVVSAEFPLPVDATVNASINADYGSGEVGGSTLRIVTATDNVTSVNIVGGSSAGTEYADGATDTTPAGGLSMGYTGDDGSNIFALRTHSGVVNSGVLRVVHVNDVAVSTNVTNSVEVKQVSGFTNSVNVVDAFGSTSVSGLFNPDNRMRVSVETGGSGLTDAELRAAHLDVQQVSGFIDSVKVTGFDTSIAASIVDSSGVGYSGLNPIPVVIRTTTGDPVETGNQELNVNINDVAVTIPVSTTQSFETKQVSGAVNSTNIVGYPSFSHQQVSVTTSSTLVVGINTSRARVLFVNQGTTDVYLGGENVSSTNGLYFAGIAGNQMLMKTTASVYAISGGTQTISYMEETF